MRRRLWLGFIAALGVVALFWLILTAATSGGGRPHPRVTATETAPGASVTVTRHARHHHPQTPVRPAPTNPAAPVTPSTVTRVEHPPTRSTTVTRTRPAPPPSTRTVTRTPTPRPSTSTRPNPIRSVVCGLLTCKETP